jgi:hypothetical protein
VVLGAARMLAEEIRLGCGESFFFFSLFPRKSRLNFQKNYCVLRFVILSILVLLLLITIYLAFEPFWSFIFSILSLGILFNLFFLSDLVFLLLIGLSTFNYSIFVFCTFLIIFSCNVVPFILLHLFF